MQSDDMGLVKRLRDHEGLGAALAHDRGQTGRYISAVMDEAAAAIERLVAERDEAESVQKRMAKDWLDFCEAMGVRFDTHEAVAYSLGAEWSKLEAQRDKLKEALTEIAASQHGSDGWVAQRARQALKDAP